MMENNFFTPYSKSGKWGFKGLNNEAVVQAIYDRVDPFAGGYAVAVTDGKYLLLNTLGEIVLPPEYDDIKPREDLGGYIFQKDGKMGFFSLRGEKTEPRFGEIGKLAEGLIPVSENGKWGFVNSKFETIIPLNYTSAKGYRNGVALVEDEDGNCFMIDHSNRLVSDGSYKYISPEDHRRYDKKHLNYLFSYHHSLPNGLKVYRTSHEEIYEAAFSPSLQRFVLDKLYHSVRDAGGKFLKAGIKTDGDDKVKWGVFDCNGDQILPVVFDDVTWIGGNCFAFKSGNKWGVITRGLELVKEPVLTQFPEANNGLLKMERVSNLLIWTEKTDSQLSKWIAGRLIDLGFKPASAGEYEAFFDPSGNINYYSYELFDENRINHPENSGLTEELKQISIDYLSGDSLSTEMILRNDTTDDIEFYSDYEGQPDFDLTFLVDSFFMADDAMPAGIFELLNNPSSWMLSQVVVITVEELEPPHFEDIEDDYSFFGLSLNDGSDSDGDEWMELDEDGYPVEDDDDEWNDEDDEEWADEDEEEHDEDEDKDDEDEEEFGIEDECESDDETTPDYDEENANRKAAEFLEKILNLPDSTQEKNLEIEEEDFDPDFEKWRKVFPEDDEPGIPPAPDYKRVARVAQKPIKEKNGFDSVAGQEKSEQMFEEELDGKPGPISGKNKSVNFNGKGMIVKRDGTPLYLSKKSNVYHWGEGSYIEFDAEAFGDEATLLNSRFEPLDPSIHPCEIDSFATGGHLRVISNGYYGMIDRNGDLVVEPVFRSLSNFHGKKALGITSDKTFVISEKYEYNELPFQLERFHSFNGNILAGETLTLEGKKWGLLNISGEVLIPFEYELILPVGNGACLVRKNGLFGIVDENNIPITPLIYKGYSDVFCGVLPLRDANGYYSLFHTEKRKMLDTFNLNGDLKSLNAIEVTEAGEGFVVVRLNNGTEYLNLLAPAEGELIFKPGNYNRAFRTIIT